MVDVVLLKKKNFAKDSMVGRKDLMLPKDSMLGRNCRHGIFTTVGKDPPGSYIYYELIPRWVDIYKY